MGLVGNAPRPLVCHSGPGSTVLTVLRIFCRSLWLHSPSSSTDPPPPAPPPPSPPSHSAPTISSLLFPWRSRRWVWLAVDTAAGNRVLVTTTANQDVPWAATPGRIPILGLDVWEHAYYLQYKNKRPDYVEVRWGGEGFTGLAPPPLGGAGVRGAVTCKSWGGYSGCRGEGHGLTTL